MFRKHSILLLLVIGMLCACKPRSEEQAQRVVAQADSLWHIGKMYGVDEGDSATLAQAYETLKDRHSSLFSFVLGPSSRQTYAHACYHYGKLLRAKDNPEEAMRCFINATHSRTHDYHILGRIYNNIGDMCHLAGEYQLSHDMFKKSADMFLCGHDTLSYYYCLNDMAYEMAEQRKPEETKTLLAEINSNCLDEDVLAKSLETRALLFRNTEQYDSVIETVNILQQEHRCLPMGFVLKASAFWHLDKRDSALFYAKFVLDIPNGSKRDKFNMLYIVLNGDSTLSTDEIKALSDQRADLEMLELVPLHKKHAVAVNELRRELNRTPRSRTTIFIVCAVIGILIIFMLVYAYRIRKAKSQQQKILKDVKRQQAEHLQHKRKEIEYACSAIRSESNWQNRINWKDYDLLCEYIDKHFFFFAHELKEHKDLSEREIRLCILVLIGGFSDKQMADILCYGEKSIRGIKRYVAKKMGTNSANLRNFLLNLIIK